MGNIGDFDSAIRASINGGSRFVALVYIEEAKPYSSVLTLKRNGPALTEAIVEKVIRVSEWCFNSAFNKLNRRVRSRQGVKIEVLVLGTFPKSDLKKLLDSLRSSAGVDEFSPLPWVDVMPSLIPYGAFRFTLKLRIPEKRLLTSKSDSFDSDEASSAYFALASPREFSRRKDADPNIMSIRMGDAMPGVNNIEELVSYMEIATQFNKKLI